MVRVNVRSSEWLSFICHFVLHVYNYNTLCGKAKTVVLKLGSIEPQGFVESLSGVRQGSRHTHYSPVHTSNVSQ